MTGNPPATALLTLSNARLVLGSEVVSGSLAARGGVITAVGHAAPASAAPANAATWDMEGDYLLPGLVELHTDYLETQMNPRPGVLWPAPVAAVIAHDAMCVASGITTVLDSICVGDPNVGRSRATMLGLSIPAIREARAKGLLRADHLLHLRCEICDPRVLDILAPHIDEPGLRLVSLMDHTPGQRQFADDAKFRQYYNSKHVNWSDEAYNAHRRALIEQQQRHAQPNRRAIVDLCRRRSIPLASHDDTTAAHVLEGQADGVTVSEFPTTPEAARACKAAGIAVMAGAPNVVRGGSHSGNVSALDLASAGLVDCLSSDYAPKSLLHGAFLLHTAAGMSLPAAIAAVTSTPAKAVGLADRGRLEPGLRADLLRVAVIDGQPVVRSAWVAGRQVY